jgi:hypothetical protein
MDAVVFIAFVGIQVSFAALHSLGHFKCFAVFHRIAENHWVIWFFHPTIIEGTKEFLVHIIVYSGHVIGVH